MNIHIVNPARIGAGSSSLTSNSQTCAAMSTTFCSSKARQTAKRQRLYSTPRAEQGSSQPVTLDNGRQLALLRAQESAQPTPLLSDPFAETLAEASLLNGQSSTPKDVVADSDTAFDLVAARFVDDQVLLASSNVNTGRNQEYNQIVLVGDGYCTRAFRLPWPSGTVIYLVAPGEVHERAEALLAGQKDKARAPRGCLLRRVDCDILGGKSCALALQRAGYRADRVSVWALQGIRRLHLDEAALESVFADISNLAALESILVGELPATTPAAVDNLLASFGLLGTSFEPEAVAGHLEGSESQIWWKKALTEASGDKPRPLLFRAQQRRLSLQEIELYESHVAAAEEVDEDFFGNFS